MIPPRSGKTLQPWDSERCSVVVMGALQAEGDDQFLELGESCPHRLRESEGLQEEIQCFRMATAELKPEREKQMPHDITYICWLPRVVQW